MTEAPPTVVPLRRRRLTALWLARMVPTIEDLLRRHQVARARFRSKEQAREEPWAFMDTWLQGASLVLRSLLHIHARPSYAVSYRHYNLLYRLLTPSVRRHVPAERPPQPWEIVSAVMNTLEADLEHFTAGVQAAEDHVRLEDGVADLRVYEARAERIEELLDFLEDDGPSAAKLGVLEKMLTMLSAHDLVLPPDAQRNLFVIELEKLIARLAKLIDRVTSELVKTRQQLGLPVD